MRRSSNGSGRMLTPMARTAGRVPSARGPRFYKARLSVGSVAAG